MLQFISNQFLLAQKGVVEGQVVAIENNDTIPMPGVHVIAYQFDKVSGANAKILAEATDSIGNFSLSLPKSTQEYILHFSSIGYKNQEKKDYFKSRELVFEFHNIARRYIVVE